MLGEHLGSSGGETGMRASKGSLRGPRPRPLNSTLLPTKTPQEGCLWEQKSKAHSGVPPELTPS